MHNNTAKPIVASDVARWESELLALEAQYCSYGLLEGAFRAIAIVQFTADGAYGRIEKCHEEN